MARWNELLVGRYNRFAQKLFGMKGASSLNQLDNVLQCVLPLFYGAENRYLEAWDLFSNGPAPYAAPGAGNLLISMLRNPPGSNTVAVITRVQWEEAAATNASLVTGFSLQLNRGPITADQNTIDTNSRGWDNRGRPSATCVLSHNTAAPVIPAGGFGLAFGAVAAFVPVDLLRTPADEVPLLPGMAALMISGNTNTAAVPEWWWRERALEDSEFK